MSSLISFFVGGTLFNFNYTPIGLTRGWHWSKSVFLPSGKGRRPPPCGRICWPRGPWEEDQASPLVSTPKHNTTINHQTLHIVPVSFVDLFHIHAILIRSRKIYFLLHKNVWTMNKTFWQKNQRKSRLDTFVSTDRLSTTDVRLKSAAVPAPRRSVATTEISST